MTGQLIAAILPLCAVMSMPTDVNAQGCVQSRGAGVGTLMQGEDTYLAQGGWQASVGYRWLNSSRHFRGGEEQYERYQRGDDVRNDSHFVDLGITYGITKRISVSFTLPFVSSTRSSVYEHENDKNPDHRHTTSASGLADIRLTSTVWVFDPDTHHEGNLAFGLGIKAPTGDAETTGLRYRLDSNGAPKPGIEYNDQSIQPGDGGWGVIIETQGFQKIVANTYAYMQASYLISPQEMNEATKFSTPDSYLLRAGLSYTIWPSKGLSLSLGARMEGVPVTDWVGGSEGSRRPGYAISIEPGITWVHGKWAISVTAPVAIERNRERSVSDERTGKHGDAAFADYIITSNISYRF